MKIIVEFSSIEIANFVELATSTPDNRGSDELQKALYEVVEKLGEKAGIDIEYNGERLTADAEIDDLVRQFLLAYPNGAIAKSESFYSGVWEIENV